MTFTGLTGILGLNDKQRISGALAALRDGNTAKAVSYLIGTSSEAYLMARMDVETHQIQHVSILSEDNPEMHGSFRWLVITQETGATYAESRNKLIRMLATVNPHTDSNFFYEWVIPLLSEDERNEVLRRRR